MRALHVFPIFPGDPTDGSAVFERELSAALVRQGVAVEVLTTRTHRFVGHGAFDLRWPNELPAADSVDGIPVHRLRALERFPLGEFASRRVIQRWRREEERAGKVVPGSRNYHADLFARARTRPRATELLAELGRGPVVPGLVRSLPRLLRDKDVVLVGYAPFALMRHVERIAARAGKPVVLLPFFHDQDPYHHFGVLYAAYERASAMLVPSPHTEALFRRYLPASRPVTIGAGVDIAPFTDVAIDGRRFREKHGLDGRKLLLFVGRKEASKRYDLVVAALAELPRDVTLVMVGKDADLAPLGNERVVHLGPLDREELVAAYDACDVFVLPSEHESFGMVILEAWLRGKPVIGNARCGAVAALVDEGIDGMLCSSASEIAGAARDLLADPDKSRRLGEAGRRKVLRDFTWDRVASRTLAVYEKVVTTAANHAFGFATTGVSV